jgi:hypothetical protein
MSHSKYVNLTQYVTNDVCIWRYALYGRRSLTADDVRSWIDDPQNPAQDFIGSILKSVDNPAKPLRLVMTDSIAKSLRWQLKDDGWTQENLEHAMDLIGYLVEASEGVWVTRRYCDTWGQAREEMRTGDSALIGIEHEDVSVLVGARAGLQYGKQTAPAARGVLVTADVRLAELRRWQDVKVVRLYQMATSHSDRYWWRTSDTTWKLVDALPKAG